MRVCEFVWGVSISIHALLAESDIFNACCTKPIHTFLSTLSLRRATSNGGDHYSYVRISIHALLAESDIRNAEAVSKYMTFLSTLSLRRATA